MSQLKVAVIGAGHLGRIHTRLLSSIKLVELVAVADPSVQACQNIEEEFGVRTVADYQSLIPEIDAAVIATPTRFHFEITANLLENQIHCLVEKPLTDSVADATQLVKLAEENNCVVSVGHCERYNAATKTALKEVGTPKFVQTSRQSGYTFRSTDIGVVHDLMIHDIDLVNSMFPGNIVDVRATGISVFGKNEDIAQARLEFSCGGVANLTASRCSFAPERRIQIFGTEGFATANLADQSIESVRVPAWVRERGFDFHSITPEQQAFIRENLFSNVLPKDRKEVESNNAILAEQKDWIEAIKCEIQPRVTVQHGKEAVEIAQFILDYIGRHRWSDYGEPLKGALATPHVKPDAVPMPSILVDQPVRKAA